MSGFHLPADSNTINSENILNSLLRNKSVTAFLAALRRSRFPALSD